MVFAVQCPEPRCRKYMLVEEHDRGTVVACLVCKTPIRVGTTDDRGPKSEVSSQSNNRQAPSAGR